VIKIALCTEIMWRCSFADQSTANATTSKGQGSRLASAGELSPTENIYTKLKLSFAIDSIQMELFTGDRDVVNAIVVITTASVRKMGCGGNLSETSQYIAYHVTSYIIGRLNVKIMIVNSICTTAMANLQ